MAQKEREAPRHDTVMDVTEERIARVYAQAFLGAVAKRGDAGGSVEELTAIVHEVLDKFPKLDHLLRSALLAHEHKSQVLDQVLGNRVSSDVLNFLKVLSKHDRLVLLRQVAREVEKLYADQCGRQEVEVRIAREIDESLTAEIRDRLRKGLGKEPVLKVVIDPSLIAGIVVRAGDRVFDGSVRTQLNNVRRAMIARAAELIEAGAHNFIQTAG